MTMMTQKTLLEQNQIRLDINATNNKNKRAELQKKKKVRETRKAIEDKEKRK